MCNKPMCNKPMRNKPTLIKLAPIPVCCLLLVLRPAILPAQQKTDLQQILERMDRLEQENRDLASEVHALRQELAASHSAAPEANPALERAADAETSASTSPPGSTPAQTASVEEQVAVQERQLEDLAQTKVQSSQKLPVTLTGMVLFNGFMNSRASGGQQDPTQASRPTVRRTAELA